MRNANHKTTVSWRNAAIATAIITNLFMGIIIINQNDDIIDNQQTIIKKENSISYSITNTADYITGEIHRSVDSINFPEIIPEDISCKSSVKSKIQTNEYSIPDYDTSFKAYMDYRAITDKSSAQYMLQREAYTDDMGLRKYEDHYIVAMGTYYSDNVGDTFKITLDNDTSFNVIIGDIKADCHTDSKNMYSPVYNENGNFISANVIEFIVDTKKLDKSVKRMGTVSAYDIFKGNIVKIERTDIYE